MGMGFSRSAARGHPKKGETPVSMKRRIEKVLQLPKGHPLRSLMNSDILAMGISSVDAMADFFQSIGLTRNQAYTLAFSP